MNETCEQAGDFLRSLLLKTGLRLEVSIKGSANECLLDLNGPDSDLLLAEGAELLQALQHLVNQAFGRMLPADQRLVCDVGGFRAAREAELRAMALHAADRVRKTGVPFVFGSMSPNERRIIHLTLAACEDLQTQSVGEGLDRKVKIALTRAS